MADCMVTLDTLEYIEETFCINTIPSKFNELLDYSNLAPKIGIFGTENGNLPLFYARLNPLKCPFKYPLMTD
jgi:hypothetical protein